MATGERQLIGCPGDRENPKCASCTDRDLRVTGHHKNLWNKDENGTYRVIYVTPPCYMEDKVIKVRHDLKNPGKPNGTLATETSLERIATQR